MKIRAQILLLVLISLTALLTGGQTRDIHDRAVTLDSHVDIGMNYATSEVDPGIDNPRLRSDLVKMEKGGLDGVFLAVYVGNREELSADAFEAGYKTALAKFEAIHRLTEKMHPERCALALSPDEVESVVRLGKRAIMIGVENGFPLGLDLGRVKEFYDLGARYITLCHSQHNQVCDSSSPDEPLHNGLSGFGKRVVAEMNRLGMMCDVSHISEKSFWDLLEVSQAPVIASHSGCSAINPIGRNLTDSQLKALAEKGGVVQVVALARYLKEDSPERRKAIEELRLEIGLPGRREMWQMTAEARAALQPKLDEYQRRLEGIDKVHPPTSLKDFVDHIDHAVKVAGIDHVGIGTDFDGGGGIPGFNNHAEARNVTAELKARGYTDEAIRKIWGENLLRTWREVETVAAGLSKAGRDD